ncbi:MAG: TolC family protein, partial [Spirochaetota bacterium]
MNKKILIAAVLAVVPFLSFAAEEKPASKELLSYESYLSKMQKALPELKSSEISLLSAENSVKSAKAAGNVSLTSDGSYSSKNQYSSAYSGVVKESAASVGLSQKITSTGTTVSTSASYIRDDYSDIGTVSFTPAVSLKVTQPLLYNFLGKVDAFAQKDAQAQYEIEKIQLSENNKSTLNAYKKIFFQWELYSRIIRNNEDSVAQAQAQNQRIGQNWKAGLTEEDTYQQTVSSVLSYRNNLQTN